MMKKVGHLILVFLSFFIIATQVMAAPAQYMAFQKLALYHNDTENKYYLALHSIDDSTDLKNLDLDNLHIRLKTKDGVEIDVDRKDIIVIPLGDMYAKRDAEYTFFQFNLVIDTSASIDDSDLRKVNQILTRFVDRLPAPFKAQIIKFSNKVNKSPFTKDKNQLKRWIAQPYERDMTALHDAIGVAVEELKYVGKKVPLKFSVIFTDGQDTASERYKDESYFRNHIISLTSDNAIPLFIVGVGGVNVNLLKSISRFGHFEHVQNVPDVDKFFDFVGGIINGTYIFKIPAVGTLDSLQMIYIMKKRASGKFTTIQDISVD